MENRFCFPRLSCALVGAEDRDSTVQGEVGGAPPDCITSHPTLVLSSFVLTSALFTLKAGETVTPATIVRVYSLERASCLRHQPSRAPDIKEAHSWQSYNGRTFPSLPELPGPRVATSLQQRSSVECNGAHPIYNTFSAFYVLHRPSAPFTGAYAGP